MSEPVISVEGVSKRFILRYSREFLASGILRSMFGRTSRDEFWALRDVTFSVARGESVAIVGKNGSGKTTLLSIISGVTEPTTGEALTSGRIAALLQLGAGFHPELTGRENAYINAGVLGLRREEIEEVYPRIAEFSELGHFLDAPIRRYSSGMLSRLGFSIAVHVRPDILIVDEVLGVGDQDFQKKCRDRIYRFLDDGVTLLFVSHSLHQVKELCERAVYLDAGRVAMLGPVDDVVSFYSRSSAGLAPPVTRSGAPRASSEPAAGEVASVAPPRDVAPLFDLILPSVVREGRARVRCRGQRAFEDACRIVVESARRGEPWALDVEAIETDVPRAVLAVRGEFEVSRLADWGLADEETAKYFEARPGGRSVVRPEVRARVLISVDELLGPPSRVEAADVVLAPVDLGSWPEPRRSDAIDRLAGEVRPGGALGVSSIEAATLGAAGRGAELEPLASVAPSSDVAWYRRRAASAEKLV